MLEFFINLVVFYFLVGGLFVGGYTGWVHYIAHKNNMTVSVNWIMLLALTAIWPYPFYQLVNDLLTKEK